ncbi:MAG: ferritin [Saprospiraceae bacterium]
MVSDKMTDALNKQIQLEGKASFVYLAMAVWCDQEGLEGCAKFMHRQSAEEREHMLRIFHYMSEVDAFAKTPAIPQVAHEWSSIQEMFKEVYAHEQKVTASIYKLTDIAKKEKDHTTENFLQWYIAEQREEENLMRSILDLLKLIGTGPQSLYYIDKEINAINDAEIAAEGAEE